jgi:hypothetical protein
MMTTHTEAMEGLVPPVDEIAMIMVSSDRGQRPLTEAERMNRAAAWGYRQAVLDLLSVEGVDPANQALTLYWFCAQIFQCDQPTGYKLAVSEVLTQ